MAVTEGIATDPELAALVESLADNKLFLGRRYAEWCTAAPTLESAVAAAAMAQDEIGHARSLYPLLRDIAGATAETEPETRTTWKCAAFLHRSFSGWTDFIAVNLLFDTALTVLLEGARDSHVSGLQQRARRMLEEEPLHWLHAEGWTRRLSTKGNAVRNQLQLSFDAVAPASLDLFNLSRPHLIAAGVLSSSSEDLRSRFRGRVNGVIEPSGLAAL